MLESSDSYAEALEFMNERCTSFGFVSDSKVNGFVALATDLQRNNYKRTDGNVEKENIALENFKNNIVLVQANVRQELIDGAISANKNANNVYMVHAFFDILARVFGNKL